MEDLTDLEEFVIAACMKVAGREGWTRFSMYWTLPYILKAVTNKKETIRTQMTIDGELGIYRNIAPANQIDSDYRSICEWKLIGKEGIEVDFGWQSDETKMAIAKLLGYKARKISNCCASAIEPETDICLQCEEHCEIVEV